MILDENDRIMEKTNFENLRVYALSEELADKIWKITVNWNNFSRDTVGKQIVRSADSIGANIAEGAGRYSLLENKRFAHIARGSLYETKHWLRVPFVETFCRRKRSNLSSHSSKNSLQNSTLI